MTLYGTFAAGLPSPLPRLPLQYADFAAWQREWLQGEVLERYLDHWRLRLAGAPPVLDLPADRPRPVLPTYRGALARRLLPAQLGEDLKAAARRESATLFMVLLASFQALLHRYTGQDRVPVGSPIANRTQAETEGLIGFFVNTLVLVADLADDPPVRLLLARTREAALDAYAHQDLPFEKLVAELEPTRNLAHTPLFQVVLVLQNAPQPAPDLPGLAIRPIEIHSGVAKFDLTLTFEETGDGLRAFLEYNRDLFDAATAGGILGHCERLLESLATEPGRRLSDLPLLAPAELAQLLEWNRPRVLAGSGEGLLHRRFGEWAVRTPDAVAVVCGDRALTYGELERRAQGVARALRARGVGPELPVGLFAERSVELVVGLLGILAAGGAYVPLDPAYPESRLAYVLADAGVPVVVTVAALADKLGSGTAGLLLLDGSASERVADADDPGDRMDQPAPDGAAYVIYTSGSTGRPKGVVVSHRNALRLFEATQEWFELGPRDVWTLFHSPAFDFSVWEIWGALFHGGRLVVVPHWLSRSADGFLDLLLAERVTVLNQTPSAFRQLIAAERTADPTGRRAAELALRRVIFGGEALELQSLQPWYERHGDSAPLLVNMYGITETTVHVTYRPLGMRDLEARSGSVIGGAIPDLGLRLLDRSRQPVPAGVAGELCVGGAGLARGYLGRPELTAERFVPDPFAGSGGEPGARLYSSGDLARYRPDGDLEYLGRIDHQVKIRGFRIELGEIESALVRHEAVREAVVLAREDEPGMRRLVAYVVPAREPAPDIAELRTAAAETLPDYMVPAVFVLLPAIPLTAHGKVDRRALPVPEAERSDLLGRWEAPRSPVERVLTEVWAEVLGLDRVGIHDGFFALGGDSILSLRVRASAAERGVKFSLPDLFQHQTVAELAGVAVAGEGGSGGDAEAEVAPFALVSAEDGFRIPAGVEDAYPLTALQSGMLFHGAYSGEATAYHNVSSLRLRGAFDLPVFAAAVGALLVRHPALRTSFDLAGFREPLQLVWSRVASPVAVVDLSALAGADRERALDGWFAAEKESRFDGGRPPLLRFTVVLLGSDETELGWAEHHAILDGWSVASMLAELFHLYHARLGGAAGPAAPPAAGLGSFVALERDALASPEGWSYWRSRLEDAPFLSLPREVPPPLAAPRPDPQTFDEVRWLLPAGLAAGLRAAAGAAGAPLKSALLAAHLRVMVLLAGRHRLVTGLVTNGRPETAGAERLFGLFLNTVPLAIDLTPGTWIDLVRTAFAAEREMLPHRRFPLAEMQRRLGGRTLFEVMFNFVHFHVLDELPVVEGLMVEGGRGFAETNFPLTVDFVGGAADGGLRLSLHFGVEVLARRQVEALAGWFQRTLEAIATRPTERWDLATPLSWAERRQLSVEWASAPQRLPAATPLSEQLRAQMARRPSAVAVVCGDGYLTYGELGRQADRLARDLRRRGVAPEVCVGVLLERSLDLLVAVVAILEAGGVYVPLDPAYPGQRLALILDDTRAPLVLTRSRLVPSLPKGSAAVLTLDGAQAVRSGGRGPAASLSEESLAYVIYTSGSTGRPKGVGVSRAAAAAHFAAIATAYQLNARDRVLQFASPSFDVSLEQMLPSLFCGATLVVREQEMWDDRELQRRAVLEAITVADLPTAYLHQVVLGRPADLAGTPLRLVSAGGEAMPSEAARAFLGAGPMPRLLNVYGPTEGVISCTCYEVPVNERSTSSVPVGRPLPGRVALVLDAWGDLVPAGVPGELCLGGPLLARGYLGSPELTATKFVPAASGTGERVYRTGDRVRWRRDGNLEFLGRLDDQVKIRGFRIELPEVEAALAAHPAVGQAVVLVQEDRAVARRLVAYLVPADGAAAPSPEEMRRFATDRLPAFMVPAAFVALPDLPLQPNGKVDRKALPAPDGPVERGEGGAERTPPRNPAESALARIWSDVLRIGEIGVHDSFFELGGDSILSIQIVSRAREAGLRITPRQIFEHRTIAELAAVAGGPQVEPAPQGALTGALPLTPIQRWFFGQELADPGHWNQAVMLRPRGILDPRQLRRALACLLEHHDMLRLRFICGPAGWQGEVAAPAPDAPFVHLDLSTLSPGAATVALEVAAAALHRNLDLGRGPLVRMGFFDLGAEGGTRVLLVIHHLAVDGVSWRILLEDLERAVRQLAAGAAIVLPAKTTSYRRWAERLEEHAGSGRLDAELDHWLAEGRGEPALLPLDGPGGENSVGSAETATVALGEEETRRLLREVPAAAGVEIDDVLLTALLLAVTRRTGGRSLRVELEGHGREELDESLDLSRTVGWFTALYPVQLELAEAADRGEALRAVQRELRTVPRRGIGYGLLRYLAGGEGALRLATRPAPQILYNYLGQFDQTLGDASPFAFAAEPAGPGRSPRGERGVLLEVNGIVVGGRLRVSWTFSRNLLTRAAVESLAGLFRDELAGLIEDCCAQAAPEPDFPLAGLDRAQLERLLGEGHDAEDVYPLSPLQQGLLFHALGAPRSGVYVLQLSCTLRGRLDVPAFARTWRLLLARHTVLRTSFRWRGLDSPLQVVHRSVELPWREEDWRALDAAEQSRRLDEIVANDRRQGFDLDRAPLLRCTLVRLADDVHWFLWSHHHLLLDGWSGPLLMRELFVTYEALAAGGEPPLGDSRPFRDYIAWLSRQDLGAAERFWRATVGDLTAPTPLELERTRPGGDAGDPATQRIALLPAPATAALVAGARRGGVTLNAVVQGAWAVLLHRYSGQPEVVFGVTSSGREADLPGIESMIGVLINTLPLRLAVPAAEPTAAWLARLQDRLLELRRHEHTPLVDIQSWSGVPGHLPLFESLVVLQNFPVHPVEAGRRRRDVLVVEGTAATGQSNYPLVLAVQPGAELRLRLMYQNERCTGSAAARLLGHLQSLLAGMAEGLDRRLDDLPLLTVAERHQLVVEERGSAFPVSGRLEELFAAQAAMAPDAVAVVAEDRCLTAGELARRAGRLARHLQSRGVAREDRVALLLERSEELAVAVLGTLRAGGAYLPLDPVYPPERLAYMLVDSGARVVVTTEALRDRLPADGPRVVSLDRDARAIARRQVVAPVRGAAAGDLAYVIYTSGSTGRPKGVMVTHTNAMRLLAATDPWFGFGLDDVWTLFHSAAFDFSVWELWGALAYGGRLVVVPYWISRSPDQFCRLLAEQRVTVLNQTPSAFRQLMWAEEQAVAGELALRFVVFGGEALDLPALAPWVGRHGDARPTLVNMYGITETTVHVTYQPIAERDVAVGRGSVIGRAIPDLQVHLSSAGLALVPIGVPGEILVGGTGLARGYLGRPALTAERFVPDPFGGQTGARLYRSGDLARRLPDGGLEYLGRIDHQVKVRGFRIELGEIEAALERQPEVKAAAVLARQDGPGERRLVAYVVPAGSAAPDADELRRALAAELPDYMVPAAVVTLAALPLTPNGKIDRRALPTPEEVGTPAAAAEPPRTALERHLAGLFARVLSRETVGRDDDFFALGGSSLSGAVLINRLQEALGEVVHVVAIFDAPTVARLAAYLAEGYPQTVERLWGRESLGGEAPAPEAPGVRTGRVDAARLAELRAGLEPLPPAPAPRGPRNPPAVFVLAPPRSGTTLLRVMLGGHPRLFAPPELELLGFHTLAERQAAYSGGGGRDLFWLEGAVRAVMELRGCAAEEAEALIAGFTRDGWTTQDFYRQLQTWLGDRLLVDKTPSYALDPAVLARAEELFDGARYLHLIRHPYGMIRSFEEVKLDQVFFRRPHPFGRRELAELIWTASHQNILSFLAGVPQARRYALRFEELLADPRRVLAGVCEFLGITYDPLMAEPYLRRRERMTDGIHAESRMLGNVKFHEHAGIDRAVAERWREAYREDFLGAPTWAVAEALSYPREGGGAAAGPQPGGAGDPRPLSFAQERLWFLRAVVARPTRLPHSCCLPRHGRPRRGGTGAGGGGGGAAARGAADKLRARHRRARASGRAGGPAGLGSAAGRSVCPRPAAAGAARALPGP